MRFLLLIFALIAPGFNGLRMPVTPLSSRRCNKSSTQLALDAGATIPLILGTAVVVFGLFNIPDNKIDLTDKGIAQAKQKRRAERIASGEYRPKDTTELDPYRFRLPMIDDDDEDLVDIDMIGKKKGGGCG